MFIKGPCTRCNFKLATRYARGYYYHLFADPQSAQKSAKFIQNKLLKLGDRNHILVVS